MVNGNLTFDIQSSDPDSRFVQRASCERLGIQEATDAVKRIRSNVQAALDDLVQFARISALKAWNIRATVSGSGSCELEWTGPSFRLDESPADHLDWITLENAAEYKVQRGRYSDAYVFSLGDTFWFRSPEQASRYIQLARKAGELCDNWP